MQNGNIKFFSKGEEGRIASFFQDTMNWPGFDHAGEAEDHWRWKYLSRPKNGFVSCAAWDGDRVVSHAASLDTDIFIDGTVWKGGQWTDLYTRQEYRGRGLADAVARCLEERLVEQGVDIEIAFPSLAGQEVIQKRGFEELNVPFVQFEIVTNPSSFFGNDPLGTVKKLAYESFQAIRTPNLIIGSGLVEEVDTFSEDVEGLVRRFEGMFDIAVHKSPEYLNWRYTEPTGGRFRVLLAAKGDRTVGFAVLRPYANGGSTYMDIVDCMVDLEDDQVPRVLLAEAVELARREGVDAMQVWLPSDHPLRPYLNKSGFLNRSPRPEEREFKVMFRVSDGQELRRTLSRPGLRAHIMLGDSDWV